MIIYIFYSILNKNSDISDIIIKLLLVFLAGTKKKYYFIKMNIVRKRRLCVVFAVFATFMSALIIK